MILLEELGDVSGGKIHQLAEKIHGHMSCLHHLAGAALAGSKGGIMLLANGNPKLGSPNSVALDGALATYAGQVREAYVLGGAYVMPSSVYDKVADYLGADRE